MMGRVMKRIRQGHVAREAHSHWTRTGRPKEEFATYKEAKDHAELLLTQDLESGHLLTFPRPYECVLGGHYHVGNTGKKAAHSPQGATP